MKISIEIDEKEILALAEATARIEAENRQAWQPLVSQTIDRALAAFETWNLRPPIGSTPK